MFFGSVGCSFTRGERLFYHRYVDSPHTDRANIPIFGQLEDVNHMKIATVQDNRFMLDHTAVGLLSKKLNCDYLHQSGDNFGNYKTLSEWIDLTNKTERKLDFIIWQLTDPQRDLDDDSLFWSKLNSISTSLEEKEKLLHHLEVEIPEKTIGHITELDKKCKENDIDLFVWSWQDEIAKLIKNKDYFVKLIHGKEWYRSFIHIEKVNKLKVSLNKIFNTEDAHPNKFFNEMLYNSLLIKLRQRGYEV